MTGDLVKDLAPLFVVLVQTYKIGGFLIGLLGGFFGFVAMSKYLDEAESWELFLIPLILSLLVGPALHFGLPVLVEDYIGAIQIPFYFLLVWFVGLVVGAWLGFLYYRKWQPRIDAWREKITRRTELERDKKTDVRTVREMLPATPEIYDVMEYYIPGFITIGLDKEGQPVRVPFDVWTANHIQLAGTTGAGKGVAAQMALTQANRQGEAIFIFDPKNDEWAPHVMEASAKAAGVPYCFIDLRDGRPKQINPLIGVSRADLKEMFLAAFSLGEKGGDADFYRLSDRKAAGAVAALMAEHDNPTFSGLYRDVMGLPEVKAAAGFWGAYEEMAELESINAPVIGVDFKEVIDKGGVVYIVGSMRNAPVMKAQRMLMIRLVQICESRDRLQKQRSVCVFLDELKYHLSKPSMEIFGAARDKGLHALIAHQALSDLRDVPADLDAEAVVGSVIENTGIKIIYKLQDPDTADWLARRSGTKLVDEETRRINRNLAQAEIVEDERTVRQGETYLVDTNMLMNLPKRVAVFFSEELPQFVGTSPVPVKKTFSAIAPVAVALPVVAAVADAPAPTPPAPLPEQEPEANEDLELANAIANVKDDSETLKALDGDDEDPPPKPAQGLFDVEFDE